MEPRHWVGGPTIDKGVLARLKRLDPALVVTWSPYALDTFTGHVIEMTGECWEWEDNPDPNSPGKMLTGPVRDPSFYVWRRHDGSSAHFFVMAFGEFGHKQVERLERDCGRFISPKHLGRFLAEREDAKIARRVAEEKQRKQDRAEENAEKFYDTVVGGRVAQRDGKVFSYKGQSSRRTPGRVTPFGREAGWVGVDD